MEYIYMAIKSVFDIMKTPINLFGYNISLYAIFLFLVFAPVLIGFVKKLFE